MPKQRLIIKWRKITDPMGLELSLGDDSFFCKSEAAALRILAKRKKHNIARAIFYDEYGEHREVFTGRKKVWYDTPEVETEAVGWVARLIRWLMQPFRK